MRNQQRGMTTAGLIILLAFIGFVGFGIIQLVPVYLENMKIRQVLTQAREQLDGQSPDVREIREVIGKAVNIEDLRNIDYRKDFVISRTPEGFRVTTEYVRERPFIGNVYLVAKFDHGVEIRR